MDLAFLRRAERMLAREHAAPAPIDYSLLVATLSAHQATSATAKAAEAATRRGWERPNDALAELLSAGPGWRRAVRAQRGSFNPRAAQRAVNAS
ncbi:MAG TPA: hypothetical protein VGB79_15075 [Allosphingosinicella sp.]|jgi:hypothetical protein